MAINSDKELPAANGLGWVSLLLLLSAGTYWAAYAADNTFFWFFAAPVFFLSAISVSVYVGGRLGVVKEVAELIQELVRYLRPKSKE